MRALDASYAVQRSCFDRGAVERQTLPAFTSNELVSGLFFRREMKSSTPPVRSSEQRQQRPRSKSVGRITTPKKDATTSSPPAGGRRRLGTPVAASTPKSVKQSTAGNSQTSSNSPVDDEAVRGERLSNYGQGTLLVGRRACLLTVPTTSSPRQGVDGRSRLLSGRLSVDSAMSRSVLLVKQNGQDGIGELGASSPYGYAPARRRCITPVNEVPLTDSSSLFSGYRLRRPQFPSTPVSAVFDYETPSYCASAAGRRSLPRTGLVQPQGCPPAFYHPDSTRTLPQGIGSCAAGGPHWPPSTANTRLQSSATSIMSGLADNIRKNVFCDCTFTA